MTEKTTVPLATYVDKLLMRYRRGIPIIGAIVVSVAVGTLILAAEVRTDRQILSAIDAHVASLVESQDRPELQRLLKSISDTKNSGLVVIEDESIFASSRSLSELDRSYVKPKAIRLTSQSSLSIEGILTEIPIHRPNGPSQTNARMIMITPLSSILFWSFAMALLVLNVGLLLGSLFGDQLRKAIGHAIHPVGELDEAIRSLKTLKDPNVLKPTGIRELDHIRDTILETHSSLVNARDALAAKKAKELATEAYKRLIHDLHNPVAALRTMIKVSGLPHLSEAERAENAARIPEIAEQILNQVSAAKSNLDFESEILREEDIRSCVASAMEQARLASPRLGGVLVKSELPEEPVIVAHDAKLLSRAVGNLVKNSLDACRTQVRVAITSAQNSVTIQVADDGPGLSQEKAGLYLQGREKSTKGDRQAFGLAAANHIVRAHGGRIVYRASAELGGACFEIRL